MKRLAGERFGRLLVLARAGSNRWGEATWSCRCDCGSGVVLAARILTTGRSRSCGCLVRVDRNAPEPAAIPGARWVALGHGAFALVDDADYERVAKIYWALRTQRGKSYAVHGHTYMHRFLLAPGPGTYTDHINGDSLDNRRANLRICTAAGNARNKRKYGKVSRFKGVMRNKPGWSAMIWKDYERFYLGFYLREEDAARAYDAAAIEKHGEFARLNFPPAAGCVGKLRAGLDAAGVK